MINAIVYNNFKTIFDALPDNEPKIGPILRGWFESLENGYKVYLRITKRYINGEIRTSVDVANIDIDIDQQRKGIFNAILMACEEEAANRNAVVYAESVLNNILWEKLIKRDYKTLEGSPGCLYKDFACVINST